MIERLTLKNFKGHRDASIRLSPLTIFVGPNGAGKTSALEALHYLGQLYYKSKDELFAPPRDPEDLMSHRPGVKGFSLLAQGHSGTEERSLELEVEQEKNVQIDHDGDDYETRDVFANCRLGRGADYSPKTVIYDRSLGQQGQRDLLSHARLAG